MPNSRSFSLLGVAAGLAAGAFWGLTFVAPLVAAPYSAFDLTVGRYLVFGLASLCVLAGSGFRALRDLTWRDWVLIVLLGFAGNVGCYLILSLAVPRAGTAVAALIIGCLPAVMGVLGNRGPTRIPMRRLAPSLLTIGAGLLVANVQALLHAKAGGTLGVFVGGVALAVAALVLWSWYGLRNASALSQRRGLSPVTWTALTGLGTVLALVPVLVAGGIGGWSMVPALGLAGAMRLVIWSLVLGLLSSWAATWAWAVAARRLPVSLAAQLIVAETVFALVYGAIYQGRWPSGVESVGAGLLLVGVAVALKSFEGKKTSFFEKTDQKTFIH